MNTVSGKGFVEKSETAVKTNNSALLSEYNIPNADLSHSEYIQESQNTNHYANSKQPTPNGDSERRLEPLSFGNVQNGGGKSGDIGFYGEIGVKNQTLETKAFPQEVEKHTNRYDLRKQTTSNDGSEWRQEQLSFGNAKNGGGKSGDLGFHGEVGVKNEILETKAFPQEVEKPFKGNNTEKLMFGMSQSGGGKMNSEPEYPTTAIQKVNLLAVESVPLLKSPANRNFNFSERSSEKPQMEKHEDEQLPNNVQTSEAAVIEKVDPSVLDEKNFQEETMVYWRRPSILEQNTHTQLPKRLETVRATDVKPSKEWEKMESNSSVGQSTSGEINSDITFDSQLVKSPTKNKVTLNNSIEKTTAELPTSNVEAPAKAKVSLKTSVEKTNELPTSNEEALVKVKPVYSLEKTRSKLSALNDSFLEFTRESKASASVQKSDKLISPTNDEPAEIKSLSEKRNREFVHYPKPNILQQKANIMPISLSSEKRNVDPAVPEQVMSPDSQNKHNFKVLTFKERLNETPTVPLSNPKQFQSLRNFWGTKDKSLSKPEISLRRARNLHGSKDSGFVKLETNLGHTAPDGSLNQDKWSFSEESHISPREWYKKAAEPSEIVPSRVDVVETVNKAFVPSKSENDAFKSSLERLGKESAKNSDDSENKLERTLSLPNPEAGTLKTEIQNKSLEDKSQPPQESFYDLIKRRSQNLKDHQKVQEIQHPEVRETAGQENAPRLEDSNELKVNLEKAQKESLVANSPFTQTSEITFPVPKSASMPVLHSPFSQSRDKILPEEIEEIIEKVAVPPKADLPESSVGLQKLLVEASVIGPLSSKVTQNEEAVKPEPQSIFENVNYSFPEVQKQVRLDLEEVKENVSKMEAPEKVEFSAFNSGLDKLYKEAAVFLPVPMNTIYTKKKIDTIITNQDPQIFKQGVLKPSPERGSLSSQQRQSPAEVNETVAKTTILPKVDTSAFDEGLAKLLQEAMYSANSGQSVENQSSLPDSSAYSSDYNLSVKKPTFSQVDVGKEREKLSRDVDLRNDTPVSETPNTKVVFHQKIVPTNGPPASSELYFDKENRNLEVTYPEVDDEYLRNEEADNEDLVAGAGFMSDARSGGFVRASTPVKEGGVCVKQSTLELKLSPPPNENMSGSLGSGLSDENADSYTENWKNSSHSEEDSNLVLSVLRRSANKPASSKSLEDISSAASMPEKVDVPKEESVRNAENGSTLPAYPDNRFQDPEKLKRLSKSVPDFLQDESDDRETDSTSEGSFPLGRHKKTPSSLTNLSGSSGMASLSSVSGSVMSIYSGDFGNLDIKGNIQFAIDYVEQLHEFHIFVAQCKELAVADEKKQRSDPYVKSYLLPGKEKMGKRKTAVRKKTLNPAYNEILRYKINKPVLLTQKLNLSVWHNDTFGRNSFLGEVDIDLATWDWSNKHMNWYALQPRTPAAGIGLENRGEMSIALKYTTTPASGKKTASSGEVHIWVKSCSNLPVLRGNRINSFVKCTVLPDTSRKSRQKTRSVDKTTNPVFNHTMVYDGFRAEDLREACVELTVWDHNRLANHFLGGLRLGLGSGKSYGTPVDWMDSTAYESSLWKKMINMPNEWVEDTLQLRMLMMAKMSK